MSGWLLVHLIIFNVIVRSAAAALCTAVSLQTLRAHDFRILAACVSHVDRKSRDKFPVSSSQLLTTTPAHYPQPNHRTLHPARYFYKALRFPVHHK